MKKEAPTKIKFKRLKHRFQLPLWQAIGLLEAIWHCAASNAPDGDIGRLSDDDIAAAIEWDGNAAELVTALVDCGWLDRDDDFRLIVHDWSDHVPGWLTGAYAKNKKQFADQIAKQRPKQPAKQSPLGLCLADAPILTQPNPTNPNPSQPPASATADGATSNASPSNLSNGTPSDSTAKPSKPAYSAAFERWYVAYPRKIGKGDASAVFGRTIPKIATSRDCSKDEALEWLIGVTKLFAASPAGTAGQYTPHPATWLSQGRYDDDPKEWKRNGNSRQLNIGPGQTFDSAAGADDPNFGRMG